MPLVVAVSGAPKRRIPFRDCFAIAQVLCPTCPRRIVVVTLLGADSMLSSPDRWLPPELTREQLTILRLIGEGHGATLIARHLGRDRATVRGYLADALRALGAHSVHAAVRMATAPGPIDRPNPG